MRRLEHHCEVVHEPKQDARGFSRGYQGLAVDVVYGSGLAVVRFNAETRK